jgi:GMP synthase-like glutamine amidotransferase
MVRLAMATCLVVQHALPESAWAIGDALHLAGVTLDVRRTFADDEVPADMSEHDGLVVMGGAASAASDTGFPTRGAEVALIADALAHGVPTLGVCLGAQLLALAAGGSVFPGAAGPEIGWGPVELTPTCHSDPLFAGLPARLTVLHWHGDTFALPSGADSNATRLAGNARYANQAFRVGTAAWGLQFHVEVTEPAVAAFLAAFGTEADGGAERINEQTSGALRTLGPWRDLLLGRFAAIVATAI